MGNGSGLIAAVTLPDQRAKVARNSALTPATLQRHRQYLGRRGFFGATSITQRATGTATRLGTDMADPAAPRDIGDQNLTGLHLLRS